MSDSIILPLEERFSKAARGRRVEVRYEEKDFLLAYDYHVKLEKSRSVFEVTLRRGGLFEGAYRCVERAIEAMAERLAGIRSAPTGYCDCREEMMYWGLDACFRTVP